MPIMFYTDIIEYNKQKSSLNDKDPCDGLEEDEIFRLIGLIHRKLCLYQLLLEKRQA